MLRAKIHNVDIIAPNNSKYCYKEETVGHARKYIETN